MRPTEDRPHHGPCCGPYSGQHDRMHHAFGPMRGPMRGAGRHFFERGGIKFAVLEHLKAKPCHGYDIIRDMEEQSGGFYAPAQGLSTPLFRRSKTRIL